MEFKKSEIQKMAEDYAKEQNSAYTNDYYGFIAGFEKAFSLFNAGKEIKPFYCASDKENKYDRCKVQCHLCKMDY